MKLQLDPAFFSILSYFMNSRFNASGFSDVPILVTSENSDSPMVIQQTGRIELTRSKHNLYKNLPATTIPCFSSAKVLVKWLLGYLCLIV